MPGPKLDAKGQPVMTNGVAVMVDVPQVDAKGAPIMTNVPVMVDAKVDTQPIPVGAGGMRSRPSSSSSPTAAAGIT